MSIAACSRGSALSPEQVKKLRDEFGIYAVGDSRINIAGLPAQGLSKLAAAIASLETRTRSPRGCAGASRKLTREICGFHA